MKKLFVWALLATMVVAGSAFAQETIDFGAPASTANDDSCDISVAPAATLLLPYFEVDLDSRAGEQTIFTITNVSSLPQVAHVTLWTDLSFPVIDFNIFLTGYDVQSISLYDVIALGQIAPSGGTGNQTSKSPRGTFSDADNPLLNEASCSNLPMQLRQEYITRMQSAFTLGSVPALGAEPGCSRVGNAHSNAVGYATIDVARVCGTMLPSDPLYFTDEGEALWDNVFVGDYQQINSGEDFAQGNPMVHIRAIPDGGDADDALAFEESGFNNFPRTFYGRYQDEDTPTIDRRQPLPATFAARWIDGGTGEFETFFKIWREGETSGIAGCAGITANDTSVTEFVKFDDRENAFGAAPSEGPVSPPIEFEFALPETGLYDVGGDTFPTLGNSRIDGWMYMNLDNDAADDIASQNWVVVSMRAEGRYSVDFDAAWLGNGCTPEVGTSEVNNGTVVIGPSGNGPDVDDFID